VEQRIELSGKAGGPPFGHPNDDFVQAGNLFRNVIYDVDRDHLVGNIADHLGNAQKKTQLLQTALFYKADPEYGQRVAERLKLSVKEMEKLPNLPQEERAKATQLRNDLS
jgi:catalase